MLCGGDTRHVLGGDLSREVGMTSTSVWKSGVSGRGHSKYKGPEVGTSLGRTGQNVAGKSGVLCLSGGRG